MASIQAERTPNPDSLKFTSATDQTFHNTVVAISSADEADRHELGERLFTISGVDDVFITPHFVTVSKTSSTDWDDLKGDVETILADYITE
jgi:hypothetical protein